MTTALATPNQHQRLSLVEKFADKFNIEPTRLMATLKATAFRQRNDKEITNEQMAALLVVADQYDLNPFTKEIYAFEDKGAIVPIVSVDGWSRIINSHPMLDGIEFRYSENIVTPDGGKPCPEWCEAVISRKDRSQPIVIREYLDEVYQKPSFKSPWQTHTKRFLRHKTLIQCSRVAFGFAGIYDQDEGERIIEGRSHRVEVVPRAEVADLQARLVERAALEHDAPANMDPATGEVPPPVEPLVDPKKLRGRIFTAETVEDLDAAAADISLLPDGDEKDEINALYLKRRAEVES